MSELLRLRRSEGYRACGDAVGEEIFHRFGETLVAEALKEADGVSAHFFRITKPCAAVFDANAVHLFRGVVVADPLHLVAQMSQQVRQIRAFCDLHLGVCKTMFFIWGHTAHLLHWFLELCPHLPHTAFHFGEGQGRHPAPKAATQGDHGRTAGGYAAMTVEGWRKRKKGRLRFVQRPLDETDDEVALGYLLSEASSLPCHMVLDALEEFLRDLECQCSVAVHIILSFFLDVVVVGR